jgi:glycine cleavage system H protein
MTVLLFVATIVTFLGIDYLVRRSKSETSTVPVPRRPAAALRFPDGIFFSKTHTWLNLFPSGTVQMGIDDFVKRMFVHPELTLLKAEGDRVSKGDAIIRMHEGGNTFFVHSPIDGRITQRNAHFAGTAGALQHESFLHGWAYQVEPAGGTSALRNFLLGAETKTWIKSEFAKLRDFMAAATSSRDAYASVFLQDGGEPMPGILSNVSPEECARFEQQFLSND